MKPEGKPLLVTVATYLKLRTAPAREPAPSGTENSWIKDINDIKCGRYGMMYFKLSLHAH